MKDYIILRADTAFGLQKQVNEHLEKGYILVGGVSLALVISESYAAYAQAVALPDFIED